MKLLCLPVHLVLFLLASSSFAHEGIPQDDLASFIRGNYTKHEYSIAMRDGVRLFTAVYVPKDASEKNRYPILMTRTPYSVAPYGSDNFEKAFEPTETLARAKYIFVLQDVRGKFMSEGEFVDMRPHIASKKPGDVDESTDTWDTIDWLVKNVRNNNGRVGLWGISYPGFYAAAGAIDAHPALKAVSPQAPIADWWIGDDFHHNGAFFLTHFFDFTYRFGQPRAELTTKWPEALEHPTPDGYEFYRELIPLSNVNGKYYKERIAFWNQIIEHPDYDAFWKDRRLPTHLKNIKPAVMTVGGWFDAEDVYGALATYVAIEKQSPGASNMLVMGPWIHGGWTRTDGDRLGDISFDQKTGDFYEKEVELPFFEHHLKGTGKLDLPEALVFETGRNQWHRLDAWPPKNAQRKALYFNQAERLDWTSSVASRSTPVSVFASASKSFDEYVSDPAKPVPYYDAPPGRMAKEYMVGDQRLQGRRTDVLTYVTDVLDDDVTIAGAIEPRLYVSTTGTDADFIVKLIDVYPGNYPDPDPNPKNIRMGSYQQLVRGEPFRGRYRNSFEKPEPFTPGETAKISFTMPDVFHTFRRGHRIMVQVQSTWFPLVDVNPQTFVPNIYKAKPEDFRKATHRVYHSGDALSHIEVSVLPQ